MITLHPFSLSACSRSCRNGGTLNEGNCTCDCVGGFIEPNCESEFIIVQNIHVQKSIYYSNNIVTINSYIISWTCCFMCTWYRSIHIYVCSVQQLQPCCWSSYTIISTFLYYSCKDLRSKSWNVFSLFAVCPVTCQNRGTLNDLTCTCDCAHGYSGDTCDSECTAWNATNNIYSCAECERVVRGGSFNVF